MSELIIKSVTAKGSRARTAVVISLDTPVKEKIDTIALNTGRSFNEIVEMLITYALPQCKLDNSSQENDVPVQTEPIKAAPPVKASNDKITTAAKTITADKIIPAAKTVSSDKTPAVKNPEKTVKTIPEAASSVKTPAERTPAAAKVLSRDRTITAEKESQLKQTPPPPAKTAAEISKTAPGKTSVRPAAAKEIDTHASVPTFKLPPITRAIDPKK